MNRVATLALKDLKLLYRDKAGLFFTFGFPLVFSIFFGIIFAGIGEGSSKMRIVVVDEDRTDGSRAFVTLLAESEEFDVEEADRATAADLVRRGKRVAYVALPKGFGEARERMLWGAVPRVETGIDPSRKAESGMLRGVLTKYGFEGMTAAFPDTAPMRVHVAAARKELQGESGDETAAPGASATLLNDMDMFLDQLDTFLTALPGAPDGAEQGGLANGADEDGNRAFGAFAPIRIESVPIARERATPMNPYAVSFPQGIIWGVLGCAATFGLSLVTERTRGTMVRLRSAPITRVHILAGKAGACFTATVALTTALLAVAYFFFSVRPDSMIKLAIAVLSIALCFVGIMMFLSVLGKTEQAAGGIGWAVLMGMAMIGGGMVPVFIMPKWLQNISDVSPVRWSILVMEGGIWRGFTFGELLPWCGLLVGTGIVAFAAGVVVFRRVERA